MTTAKNTISFQVISFAGLRADSLGGYFMGMGLLSALTQKWPGIRGCWRNGCFSIVAKDLSRDVIQGYLLEEWQPPEYKLWWSDKQKADTKAKSDQNLWQARSWEEARRVIHLDAHIIGVGRNQFNPIFGTGGNIGKRNIAKVVQEASNLIRPPASASKKKSVKGSSVNSVSDWLKYTLWYEGEPELPELSSTGTWFVFANKTFNSGQDWHQEGRLSPWSLLLALEGALLLVGGVNRRWSAVARPYAVFPFITDRLSPKTQGEVGLSKAEFWAPLWSYPATLAEVRALFERGLARIGERTAKAPHEFALAARAAGADVGVFEFARFVLRQTTSAQTYEAIPQEHIVVSPIETSEAELMQPLLLWLDRLPYEPSDSKQSGKFKGLRGPIEDTIIHVAQQSDKSEHWQQLLLLLSETQSRIDTNRDWRKRCNAIPYLKEAWFEKAWPEPPTEICVARAIASIGAGTEMPLLVNIFGVELKNGKPFFSDKRPQRAIWHHGDVVQMLAAVLQRRLIDTEPTEDLPLKAPYFCDANIIGGLLAGALDWELIGRWIPPLSLIHWSWSPHKPQATAPVGSANGLYLVSALYRPFFHPYPIKLDNKELFPNHLRPKALIARHLLNLIRQGEWFEAAKLVESRYQAAKTPIVTPPTELVGSELVAASLLIPVSSKDVVAGIKRWVQTHKSF